MDTTEIRTKLADAVNGVVAMSDEETEQTVDAIVETLNIGNTADNQLASKAGWSCDDPLDELTLTLSRAQALAWAINDVASSGEQRDMVGLAAMTIREIENAYKIASDDLKHSKYWRTAGEGA